MSNLSLKISPYSFISAQSTPQPHSKRHHKFSKWKYANISKQLCTYDCKILRRKQKSQSNNNFDYVKYNNNNNKKLLNNLHINHIIMIYSFSYSHDLYIFSVVFHEISHIYNNEMKRYISYVNHTHSLCLFVIPCSLFYFT